MKHVILTVALLLSFASYSIAGMTSDLESKLYSIIYCDHDNTFGELKKVTITDISQNGNIIDIKGTWTRGTLLQDMTTIMTAKAKMVGDELRFFEIKRQAITPDGNSYYWKYTSEKCY